MKVSMSNIDTVADKYKCGQSNRKDDVYKEGIKVLDAFRESKKPSIVKQVMASGLLENIIRSTHRMYEDVSDDAFDDVGSPMETHGISLGWLNSTLFYKEEMKEYTEKIEDYHNACREYDAKAEEFSKKIIEKINAIIDEANKEMLEERKQINQKYYNTIKEMVAK